MNESEKSGLELEKLRWEVESLRQNARWERRVGRAVSLLGPALVFTGLIVGGCQYREGKEREFRKVLWEKQLEVYDSMTRSAGRLVGPGDTADREAEYQRFMTLYNGPLRMVADSATALEVRAFYSELTNFRSDPGRHTHAAAAARAMALSFRNALRDTWRVPLTPADSSTF